jgi:hypothetical protein
MRKRSLVAAFAAGLATAASPGVALADRDALTLDLSPAVTWWPAWGPAVGSGSGVVGTTAGGMVGVRYALRHDLDVTVSGLYEAHVRASAHRDHRDRRIVITKIERS